MNIEEYCGGPLYNRGKVHSSYKFLKGPNIPKERTGKTNLPIVIIIITIITIYDEYSRILY